MRKWLVITLCVFFMSSYSARADIVANKIPNAQQVGKATFTYVFWEMYDISLHAPQGRWSFEAPFALVLEYSREIKGSAIADRSAQEIRSLGYDDELKIATWHTQMTDIFPDVHKGSRLIGIYTPNQPTYFFDGKEMIGKIDDPAFGKWFFGIWLDANTSEPQLRERLLGVAS